MATLDQQYNSTLNNARALRYASNTQVLIGQQFTPSVSNPIAQVDLKIYKYASPTGNCWVEIWSDSGSDTPNTKIGGNSSTKDVSTLQTSAATETFTWSSNIPSLVSGTKYWIVLNADYAFSTTNWIAISTTLSGAYSGGFMATWNATSWSATTEDFWFNEYCSVFNAGFLLNMI